MAGEKTRRAVRDQRRERPRPNQGVDPRHIVNTKRIGPVHGVAITLRTDALSKATLFAPASGRARYSANGVRERVRIIMASARMALKLNGISPSSFWR
jgi:hypothetical protein